MDKDQTQKAKKVSHLAPPQADPNRSDAPLPRSDVARWLGDTMCAGDLLLSGSRDSLSRLIRWGTMSDFSHTSVALSAKHLIESYDWAGTPSDADGGVARLDVRSFAERGSLLNLALLRPKDLDRTAFARVADHVEHHSPPFPSTTGLLLALAGLGDHPTLRIPGARAYVEKRLHLLGDGAARVTCAEFAARLYLEAGLHLQFQTVRLLSYVELLGATEPARLQAVTTRRQLDPTHDAELTPATLAEYAAQLPQALSARSDADTTPDWVDLLMPGDFLRSANFDVVAIRSVEK